MDGDNWGGGQVPKAQPQAGTVEQLALSGAPPMDPDDWRAKLPLESRQRVLNKIMETLNRLMNVSGRGGLQDLKSLALKFEEKIYSVAASQSDYLKRISMKMLTMETKSQTRMANSLQTGAASHSMQSKIHNQELAMPIVGGQSQGRQQLLSQNTQNTISAASVQNSGSLASTLPAVSNLTQVSIANGVGQNSNLQSMQNNSNVAQNSIGNSMGQGMPSNMFANSQRQMQGRQQQVQQQQPQNPAHLFYHQKLQQQHLMKQKLQSGGMAQSMLQCHAQKNQQQHQNIMQTDQIHSSQQAVMQPTMMQSASVSGLQQNHQSSAQQSTKKMLERQPQPVLRQHQQQAQQVPILHLQQTSMAQQPMLQTAQIKQEPLTGPVSSDSGIQQNQLIGQQNNIQDPQKHRLMSHQSNSANLQQQQLISQQNSGPNMHQLQLGGGVSGLQQSTMLGMQSVATSGMPSNQHSVHMLQQKVPVQQQLQQNMSLLQNQSLQPQPSQQQIVSQMPSNSLQHDMQHRLSTSGAKIQQQNLAEQKQQFFQSQRAMQEAPSSSLDSTAKTGNASAGDWQEEVYQKIKSMKNVYLLELNELSTKIATKLQQIDALPQQPKTEQITNLKSYKAGLDKIIYFLQISKNEIQINHKGRLGFIESQIINMMSSSRPCKPASCQPGQLPQSGMQNSQPQSQISHMQTHENQMNAHTSGTMSQNNLSALHHNTGSSVPSISSSHQNTINSLQPSSQQVPNSSKQNNTLSGLSSIPSQVGVNTLQANLNSLPTNNNMLQNQHIRQQEQQMLHSQQLKRQMLQKQMHQQLMHNQQLMPPQQQMKQQPSAHLPGHTMSPLHQVTDSSDVKMRQQMGVKPGDFQQHHSSNQRSAAAAYASQQVKPGSPFSIPSPQVLQAGSPQVPQQPSPQINQQNLATFSKTGTPLHSVNSPFMAPFPSTPVAPSPINGESEKVNACLSPLSNTYIGQPQAPNAAGSTQSLAIGTPGISASPLLEEFASPDGAHGNTSAVISGRSDAVERPIDRLIKAVKSASQNALSASVSDISSIVSMIERIGESSPGNRSIAAVGEDLVAMTTCHMQDRNFFAQDGPAVTKKLKRCITAIPSFVVLSAGSISNSVRELVGSDAFDLESTATSPLKRPRIEINNALSDEILDINRRLIDTLVEISAEEGVDLTTIAAVAEGTKGTIVKCSYTAVALSSGLKSKYASPHMSPIQPLRMLIPINYPNCSPILLDNFPAEISKEYEDLSMKTKSRYSISLRSLSQPMSLTEMAKTWDHCTRTVISEYAQQSGGGTFSSTYGTWENCVSVS